MTEAAVAESLGAKLDGLALTGDEQALLAHLLTPDDGAEVVGYTASFTAMLTGMTLGGGSRPTRPGIIANMGESGSI